MFFVSFANYKPRALSHDPSSDCAIPRAEVRVRAQVSYGNITVLSHLKVAEHSFRACIRISKQQT